MLFMCNLLQFLMGKLANGLIKWLSTTQIEDVNSSNTLQLTVQGVDSSNFKLRRDTATEFIVLCVKMQLNIFSIPKFILKTKHVLRSASKHASSVMT